MDHDDKSTDDEKIQKVKAFLWLWLPPGLLATVAYLEAIGAGVWRVESSEDDTVTFDEGNSGPTTYLMARLKPGEGPMRTTSGMIAQGFSREEQLVRWLDGTPWTVENGVSSSLHEISNVLHSTVVDYQQGNIRRVLSTSPKRRWRRA